MIQRREINEMQQYKASNRAEKMIIQMGKDLIKGTKEVKKEIVKVEKEMNKVGTVLYKSPTARSVFFLCLSIIYTADEDEKVVIQCEKSERVAADVNKTVLL